MGDVLDFIAYLGSLVIGLFFLVAIIVIIVGAVFLLIFGDFDVVDEEETEEDTYVFNWRRKARRKSNS